MRLSILRYSIAALLAAALMLGQETRSTILGNVTDPTGARIPNVLIRVTNLDTNTASSARSNDSGYFEAPFLLSGKYRVEAQAAGFKRYVREGVELAVGQRVTIDLPMQVGETRDAVEVIADAPLLDTASASSGQHMDLKRMNDLPLLHNNPFLATTLVMGVTNNQGTFGARAWDRNNYAPTSAGSGWNQNEFTTDGFTDSYAGNRVSFVPTSAMTQEMRVESMSLDASSGGHTGVVVTSATRSGTNQLHGQFWEMHDQSRWNANDWFRNRNGKPNTTGRYNNFGMTSGGPVFVPKLYNGKNRTFFFFSYNGLESSGAGAKFYRMPTEKERQGDFSELLARSGAGFTIYDPLTAQLDKDGKTIVRQPFSANRVPGNRISPIAVGLLKLYPTPNMPGDSDFSNNYFDARQPSSDSYYSLFARADHQFNERNKIFFRWNMSNYIDNRYDWTGKGYTNEGNRKRSPNAMLDHVVVLNATTIFNWKIGWGMNQDSHEPGSRGIDPALYGFPSYLKDHAGNFYHLPSVNFSSMASLDSSYGDLTKYHVYSGQMNLTKIKGSHSLKTGFEHRLYQYNSIKPGSPAGTYSFNNSYVKASNTAGASNSGLEIASFLLGIPSSTSISRNADIGVYDRFYAIYIQDDWRVNRRLSFNLGLRYEVSTPLRERHNQIARDFDFSVKLPITDLAQAAYARAPLAELPAGGFSALGGGTFAGVNGTPTSLYDTDWNNLGPRAGVSFVIRNNVVIRAGYSIAYNMGIGSQSIEGNHYGFSQSTGNPASLDNGLTFTGATLADPFPAIQAGGVRFLEPIGSSLGAMTQVGNGYSYWETSHPAPYQHHWRIASEWTPAKNWVAEIAYVGSANRDVSVNQTLTFLPGKFWTTASSRTAAVVANDADMASKVANPFAGLVPRSSTFNAATIDKNRLLRAYPQMGGVTLNSAPLGRGDYKGVEGRVEKRMAKGWTLMATFLKQKVMQQSGFLNEFDTVLVRQMSADDRDYRYTANGIYEMPFGKGRRFGTGSGKFLNGLIGGWDVSLAWQTQGGVPVGFGKLFYNGDFSNIYLASDLRNIDRWFNTDGFVKDPNQQPGGYQVRTNKDRLDDRLRGDSINQWDASLMKTFSIKESKSIRLKMDAFNALNHPQFGSPNTSQTSGTFGKITGMNAPMRNFQFTFQFFY